MCKFKQEFAWDSFAVWAKNLQGKRNRHFGFCWSVHKSKYAKIKPSVEDVKLGISLYGDTVIYVKGRLKWFNLLKYFWFV